MSGKRSSPWSSSGNPFEDRGRGLKVVRLALILHEAGARTAGEVAGMGPEARGLALDMLAAGLGRGAQTASAETWRGVASLVGYLGGGSGGRRRISRTVPSRLGVDR
jgi:hypothetical protein